MNGAEAFVRVLADAGVDTVFGLPGSTEAALLEALRPAGLRYVLALHEGVAVAMADGYARVTGRPGVVGLHTSVGTLNGLSQMYNALRDGSPVVVTAGDKDRKVLAEQGFCALPGLTSVARSVTKWAHGSLSGPDLPADLGRALHLAMLPPQGPTYLSVPEDLMSGEVPDRSAGIGASRVSGGSTLGAPPFAAAPDAGSVSAAVALLTGARRPVLVAGSGARRAVPELRALAEALELPVLLAPFSDLADLAYPSADPRYLGLYGEDRAVLEGCDVVLVLGGRAFYAFSDASRPVLPPGAALIHAHDDAMEIGRVVPTTVGLLGSPRAAAEALTRAVEAAGGLAPAERERRAGWWHDLRARRRSVLERELHDSDETAAAVPIERVAEQLSAALPDDAIVVDEGVRSSRPLLRHLRWGDGNLVLRSSGGALGWGTPAAVGAKLGRPGRPVVAVVGDGSFQFSVQALWSAVAADAPVVIVVLDNGGYLAVKRAIEMHLGVAHDPRPHPGTDIVGIDHLAVAEGYGAVGIAVAKASEVGPAVEAALGSGKVSVVHVPVEQVRP